MLRRLTVLLLMMLCAGTAWAAGPTVAAVTGKVTIVRNGASRDAKVGEAIAKEDFLRIDEGASVTITLPDSKKVEVKGKALLPGRRLHDAKLAAGLSKLAVALQTVAGKQDGGTAPASMSDLSSGSGRALRATDAKTTAKAKGDAGDGDAETRNVPENAPLEQTTSTAESSEKTSWWWPFRKKTPPTPMRETSSASGGKSGGTKKRDVTANASVGETDTTEEVTSGIIRAEGKGGGADSGRTDGSGAGDKLEDRAFGTTKDTSANATVASAEAPKPPTEPRSPLDDARALAKADQTSASIAKLDAIIAAKVTDPATLADALVLRARLKLQTGADDAAVRADLDRAMKAKPGSESAREAAFLLGVLALSDGNRAEAKRLFDTIPVDHALRTQAQSLLDAK